MKIIPILGLTIFPKWDRVYLDDKSRLGHKIPAKLGRHKATPEREMEMIMTQFHEGQEVEVMVGAEHNRTWRNAKIWSARFGNLDVYTVQFHDGTRAVFDAEHIRVNEKDSGLVCGNES